MFKRKDWVLLRRGQGVEGDANSTSSSSDQSQDSDDVSSSSENLDISTGSSDREEERLDVALEQSGSGSLSEEDEDISDSNESDIRAQVREWYEAGMAHRVVRGKALRCMVCPGKRRLLLNSVALRQHIESKVHQKRCGVVEGITDVERHVECFVSADQSSKDEVAEDEIETHGERLQRIQSLVSTIDTKKGDKESSGKKRKPRPGKRQRMQKKGQKS